MKKIINIAVLIMMITFILSSCKKIDNTVSDTSNDNKDNNPPQQSEVVVPIEEDPLGNITGENAPKESNIIIEGDRITIRVPKKYQYDGESGELTPDKIQSGFIESKVNSDGSISYTMNKDSYNPYVINFKKGIILRFKTIQKGDSYKTIKKFDFNAELTKAVFWIDKNTYYGSGEESAAKNVAREMAYYQIFSGTAEKDIDVEIRFLDSETEVEIDKMVY